MPVMTRTGRGPQQSAGFLLWHVQLRWRSAMLEAMADLDLTPAQFSLLATVMWLTEEEGLEPTQTDVARHAGTDPMMTSQVLRALETRKLLARKTDKSDRRARQVLLLAKGKQVAIAALGIVRQLDAQFFDARLPDPARFRGDLAALALPPKEARQSLPR